MSSGSECVEALADRLRGLGWVTELWVAGSLATGDYVPGVSDLDLVALVAGSLTAERRDAIVAIHTDLDVGVAAGADLGCQYVEWDRLLAHDVRHPTWTHGSMVDRILSGVTRIELARHGYAVLGRPPSEVLPPVTHDDVREAAAPDWLIEQLRARRRGETVRSPRVRAGWVAWRDARRTVAAARRGT